MLLDVPVRLKIGRQEQSAASGRNRIKATAKRAKKGESGGDRSSVWYASDARRNLAVAVGQIGIDVPARMENDEGTESWWTEN